MTKFEFMLQDYDCKVQESEEISHKKYVAQSILAPSARSWTLSFWCSGRGTRSGSDRHFLLLLALGLLRRGIPVIDHLCSQDRIEHEASNEPVEDQLVVHLLHCCVDSRQGASEIVEDLRIKTISMTPNY